LQRKPIADLPSRLALAVSVSRHNTIAGLYGKSQRRPQGQTVLTFKLVAPANEVLQQLNRTEEQKKVA